MSLQGMKLIATFVGHSVEIMEFCRIMAGKFIKKADYWKIGILLFIFVVGVFTAYQIQKPEERLGIINPADLNPALVADSLEGKGMNHVIADFTLVDQRGHERTLEDIKGKIVIADFFFTTCPSICIDMTRNLRRVQERFMEDDQVMILSHTVNPEYDTVPVLQSYGQANGVSYDKWWLLTGDRMEINKLARASYFAVVEQGESFDEHSFIHTENIVLVDPLGRIRGIYDGTNDAEIDLMMHGINLLLKEYPQQ